MKSQKPNTFLNSLKQSEHRKHRVGIAKVDALLEQLTPFINLDNRFRPVVFAIDYRTRSYLLWSAPHRIFAGLDENAVREGGLDQIFEILNKDFFNTYNKEIFPDIMNSIDPNGNQLITCNLQIRDNNGQPWDYLQKFTILTSADGIPEYCVGMAFDINGYAPKDKMILKIEPSTDLSSKKSSVRVFDVNTGSVYLTPRELEVVRILSDGYSSKQCAAKLGISINTVNNHRQALLRKTATQNVAQLIGYVSRNRLL